MEKIIDLPKAFANELEKDLKGKGLSLSELIYKLLKKWDNGEIELNK